MCACITCNACLCASCRVCVCRLCAPSSRPVLRAEEGRERESEGARVRARKHPRMRAFTLGIDPHRLACMQVHQNMCISVNSYLCASHPPHALCQPAAPAPPPSPGTDSLRAHQQDAEAAQATALHAPSSPPRPRPRQHHQPATRHGATTKHTAPWRVPWRQHCQPPDIYIYI